MEIISMEKISNNEDRLPNGIIRIGIGEKAGAKPEWLVDMYYYCYIDGHWENTEEHRGSFIKIYNTKNKNGLLFHYYDNYDYYPISYHYTDCRRKKGSFSIVTDKGESKINKNDSEYKTLSSVLAPLVPYLPTCGADDKVDEVCRIPEGVFNSYCCEKRQCKHIKIEAIAKNEIVKDLIFKTRW